MDELLERLDAARSSLSNLEYSRNSVRKPDSVATLEQINEMVHQQEQAIRGILDQLYALSAIKP